MFLLVGVFHKINMYLSYLTKHENLPPKSLQTVMTGACPHLAQSALSTVKRRTFLGLTEQRVVVVTAPQLLTGVMSCVLETNTKMFGKCQNKIQ